MGKNILKNAYRVKREGTSYNSEKSSHRNIKYSSYLPFSVNGYGGDSHGGASAAKSYREYLGLALVSMWGGALRGGGGGEFLVFKIFLAKLSFWHGYLVLGYHSVWFRHFLDIS